MLEEYNDNGATEVLGTDKNMTDMVKRDLALCVRNILVQRELFGAEDPETLCHNLRTICIARYIIKKFDERLQRCTVDFVHRVKHAADTQPIDQPFYGYRQPTTEKYAPLGYRRVSR